MDNKFNYKNKFNTNDTILKDECLISKKNNVINEETILLTPNINKRDKTQLKLSSDFSPDNYNLLYGDSLHNLNDKFDFYYNNKDIGAGRGFGNLNISNNIRNSQSTRKDSKEYKCIQEGIQMFDYQFSYINNDIQNPKSIVMHFPRGGISTRKNINFNNNNNCGI